MTSKQKPAKSGENILSILSVLANYYHIQSEISAGKYILSKGNKEGWLTIPEILKNGGRIDGGTRYENGPLKGLIEKSNRRWVKGKDVEIYKWKIKEKKPEEIPPLLRAFEKEGRIKEKKVLRLRRKPNVLQKLYQLFYKKGKIWDLILSDYFQENSHIVPLSKKRSTLYSLKVLFYGPKLLDHESFGPYVRHELKTADYLSTFLPPTLFGLYVQGKDANPLKRLLGKNDDFFSELELELSYWIYDYNSLMLSKQKPEKYKLAKSLMEQMIMYLFCLERDFFSQEGLSKWLEKKIPLITNIETAQKIHTLLKQSKKDKASLPSQTLKFKKTKKQEGTTAYKAAAY